MAIQGFKKYLLESLLIAGFLSGCSSPLYGQDAPKEPVKQEQKADETKQDKEKTEAPKQETLEQKISGLEEKIKKEPKNEWNFYELGQIYFDEATKFYTALPKETKEKWDEQKKKETEPYKKWKSTIDKGDEIFLKGVEIDMKKESVEDILKGANVEFVKYDEKKRATNFDELIYQENKKADERTPVIAFFYFNKDPLEKNAPKETSKRTAAIVKNLAKKFDKIRFVCYDVDVDPKLIEKRYAQLFVKYKFSEIPSMIMYCATEKEGIKQLDISRGGPKNEKSILTGFTNLANYWILSNIFNKNPENDEKKYRYENTYKIHTSQQ